MLSKGVDICIKMIYNYINDGESIKRVDSKAVLIYNNYSNSVLKIYYSMEGVMWRDR
jgi:hypothetical protein